MNPPLQPASRWLATVFDNSADTPADGAGAYLRERLPDVYAASAAAAATAPAAAPTAEPSGSRRHRLWELPQGTLCPLMGVCLPIALLRRVLGRTLSAAELADDYQVHCAAINACTHRSAACESLQRELDLRHALALRRFAKAKTTEALTALWREGCEGPDPAGALWAGLTHPRCDSPLRERICSDIHMLQHQLGAGNRADLQRLQTLTAETAQLRRELAAAQERHARALAERGAQLDCTAAQLMRLRAEGIQKDSLLGALRDDLAALQAPAPAGAARADAQRDPHPRDANQRQRIERLEHDVARWRDEARVERQRADELAAQLTAATREIAEVRAEAQADADHDRDADEATAGSRGPAVLRDAAVLCVGGRTASVPVYRRLIEVTGGRFAHHDGGEQQSGAQLEASLAAADLVICQTGCISHGAYWRVKDHCKRTGKRCLFVDNPSASSLARSLRTMPEIA